MQLKTLSRQDPEFSRYLDGTFSRTERAIPAESLNVNSESETVTFKILGLEEIVRPGFFSVWAEVFKIRYFLLLAFPAFVILAKDLFDDIEIDPVLTSLSLVSAFLLLAAANLWNDYFDHLRGVDRIHSEAQRKPIQKGWVTAAATRRWAMIYLLLGVFLGLPAILVEPLILALVAIPGAVALWAWLNPIKGLRFRRGAEVMVFLLVGPLFAVGFQLAATGVFDLETVFIGVMTGWLGVFLLHLRNFESIVVNSQAGFHSTVVDLGFEKAKTVLWGWWGLLWLGFTVYQWIYTPLLWWPLGSVLVGLATLIPFRRRLMSLKSPLSSDLAALMVVARNMVATFWAWWLIQSFWVFLMIEMLPPLDG